MKNQIIGGSFKFPDTSPVVNGVLTLVLNRDCAIASSGQIGRGSVVTVPLDSTGNVSGTVTIWPNDQLLPDGNYYVARLYSQTGQLISGPFPMTILSSPSPFVLI